MQIGRHDCATGKHKKLTEILLKTIRKWESGSWVED